MVNGDLPKKFFVEFLFYFISFLRFVNMTAKTKPNEITQKRKQFRYIFLVF